MGMRSCQQANIKMVSDSLFQGDEETVIQNKHIFSSRSYEKLLPPQTVPFKDACPLQTVNWNSQSSTESSK